MYIGAALCLWFLRAWKVGQLEELAAVAEKRMENTDPAIEPLSEGARRSRSLRGSVRTSFVKRMFRWQKV